MRAVVLCLFLLGPPAVAQDLPVVENPKANLAEYVRLSEELDRLAKRNAWSGVERTYIEINDLGVDASAADHISGAHAARALGNITAARKRLDLANQLGEDRAVIDWLWQIDANYGTVFVAADPKKKITLERKAMSFNPEERLAVQFAQKQVEDTGVFSGLLPAGTYSFGPHTLDVVPRVQSVQIDMRTQAQPDERGRRKSHKKADRRNREP